MKNNFRKIIPVTLLLINVIACSVSGAEEPLPTLMVLPTSAATPTNTVAPTTAALQTTSPTSAPATSTSAPKPTSTSTPTLAPTESGLRVKETGQIRLNNPMQLRWSEDGKTLVVINSNSVFLYDAISLSGIANFNAAQGVTVLDFSSDMQTIATTADRKNIDLKNVSDGKTLRSLRTATQFTEGSFTPDGRAFAIASGEQIAVTEWDTTSAKQILTLKGFQTAAPVYSFDFSPDGKTLIWISRATVQLMDIATNKMGTKVSHEDFVGAVAMTQDGILLATLSATTQNKQSVGLVKLINVASGNEIGKLIQTKGLGRTFAFSPDGKLLAVGADKSIIIWDVATQKEIANITGHTDQINGIAFSPDGKTLATSSNDDTIRLWRVGQ